LNGIAMEVFVLSFVITVLAVLGLGLGTLTRGSVLKGSCGGLGAVAEASDACAFCRAPCRKRKIGRPGLVNQETSREAPGGAVAIASIEKDP
jgi:hypothetical protein